MWSLRNWYQLFSMSWSKKTQFIMHHRSRYTYFTITHNLTTIIIFKTWVWINFFNDIDPIITPPDSDLSPEKPPYDSGFMKSLWSSLIGIWICILFHSITSTVVLSLIVTQQFFKGHLTTVGWLQIQMYNFSIVSFEMFLPFFSVYTHDIYVIWFLLCIFCILFSGFPSYRSLWHSKHLRGLFLSTLFN